MTSSITEGTQMRRTKGVEMFSLSHKGQARPENQDSIPVDPSQVLFVLANEAGGLDNISVILVCRTRPRTILSRLLRH